MNEKILCTCIQIFYCIPVQVALLSSNVNPELHEHTSVVLLTLSRTQSCSQIFDSLHALSGFTNKY